MSKESFIDAVSKEIEAGTFWDVKSTQSGEVVTINRVNLCRYIVQVLGINLYYMGGSPIYVKRNGWILEEVDRITIKALLRQKAESLEDKELSNKVLEALLKSRSLSDEHLEWLDQCEYSFLKDDKDSAYYPFKNGLVVVNKDGFSIKSYDDVGKFVWKSSIIDFDISLKEDSQIEGSDAFIFCLRVCGITKNPEEWNNEETIRIGYLHRILGYLLHGYKDPAKPYAVIFEEMTEESGKGGGSGKGLLASFIKKMIPSVTIGGKTFSPKSDFAFQSVTDYTRLVNIEDTDKNFDFESFFNAITDGLRVRSLYSPERNIPASDSPKFLFTTNYVIKLDSEAAKRRAVVFEFSTYFGRHYTPYQEFKRLLLNKEDWDCEQWALFYNFLFGCVRDYLANGLAPQAKSETTRGKLIRQECGDDFYDWFTSWYGDAKNSPEKKYKSSDLYEQFREAAGIQEREYAKTKFGISMKKTMSELCINYVKDRDRSAGGAICYILE